MADAIAINDVKSFPPAKLFFTESYLKNTEIRVVVVGKTGKGKSKTANTLLGKLAFKTSSFAKSATEHCQIEKMQRFEKTFIIVDTPGFLDTCKDSFTHKREVEKVIPICSPGVHVFLIIMGLNRYTEEEILAVKSIIAVFGEELYHYSIVVFTHKDQLAIEDETEEGFIESVTDSLRELLNLCGNRYTFLNNSYKDETLERKEEGDKLLKYIIDFVEKNEYKYYSDAMFKKVEETFRLSVERSILLDRLSNIEALLQEIIIERDEERLKTAKRSRCPIL